MAPMAMTGSYDRVLVVTSVAIAIFASYIALDMTARLSGPRRHARRWWWLCAPVAMGLGIWSMHFVGMVAFHLDASAGGHEAQVSYDGALVLLSVCVAIAASALGLFVASRPSLPLSTLGLGSLCMGGAISGMHYIGMAAMRLPADINWRWGLVTLSVVIAIAASFAALLLAFRLRRTAASLFGWWKLGAASLMGVAISGMHYTGMAAAQFTAANVGFAADGVLLHTPQLGAAVVAGTIAILSVALAGAAFDERARLLAMEQRARGEAEAANRLKDEFLATLSHELRTPLNVILGRAHMLQASAGDAAKTIETAGTITRNAEALKNVVEDLLDVSRMSLGGLHLNVQPTDLADVLVSAADSIRPGANAKGIRMTINAPHGLPRVTADAARLQQVIWNLLTNAVKFTPPGGHIRCDLRRQGSTLVLSVTDTGRGIDPGFLPHVFDMFRQAESAASRTEGGLGIGLSIVRRLVELHGGTVSADSAGAGKGATFEVTLPCGPPVENVSPQRSSSLAVEVLKP